MIVIKIPEETHAIFSSEFPFGFSFENVGWRNLAEFFLCAFFLFVLQMLNLKKVGVPISFADVPVHQVERYFRLYHY